MKQFNNGVAVITGAAAGLGKAMAVAAAQRGMQLVLADIEAHVLEQTVSDLQRNGAQVISHVVDVSDASAVDQLARLAMDRFGQVHLLFNNAGVTAGGLVWENTEKDWDWLLGVNLRGVINGIRSFTPRMLALAAADPDYEGCIVNTASMAGLLTAPGMGIYSVSKHAVVALSECLRHDLQMVSSQLRAAVLCPSFVSTDIGHCERNRPAHLQDDTPLTKSQLAARAASQQAVKNGAISAEEVAEITFKAIANDSFYIFPSPQALPLLKARIDHALNQTNPDLPYDMFPALKQRRDHILSSIKQ